MRTGEYRTSEVLPSPNTVIGHQFFAVAIHADSAEARRDWRSDYVRHEALFLRMEVGSLYSIGALSQQCA